MQVNTGIPAFIRSRIRGALRALSLLALLGCGTHAAANR
jgi:hypothetical protein